MVAVGVEKVKELGLEDKIELMTGDSEAIQFPDKSFDAVTVAFGVRNFENLGRGLDELFRVLNRVERFVCLNFQNLVMRWLNLDINFTQTT